MFFLSVIIFPVQNIFAKDYVFIKSLTCKDVDISNLEPINTTNQFLDIDDFVVALVYLENVYKSLVVNFKWYNPQDVFILERSFITDDPFISGFEYWDWYHIWGWINIAKVIEAYPTMNIYGKWYIDIFVDEKRASRLFFTLNPAVAKF